MSGTVHRLYPGPDEEAREPNESADLAPLAATPEAPHDPPMNDDRISRLEGFIDGFRVVPQIAITMLSVVLGTLAIVLTIGIFALNSMNAQIRDVGARVDAIPKQLSEEFRAMRAETSAQTSAIANSITAARQFQPQVVIVPAPAPAAPASPQEPAPPPKSEKLIGPKAPP